MKFFAILIGFALILATSSSSENEEDVDDESLINIMVKILNTRLEEDEIPIDQIPASYPKSTTLSLTPGIMENVQNLRDYFGSPWNRN